MTVASSNHHSVKCFVGAIYVSLHFTLAKVSSDKWATCAMITGINCDKPWNLRLDIPCCSRVEGKQPAQKARRDRNRLSRALPLLA